MLFINFTAENADSLKSKYREAAEQYKQDGISFLVGDVEASQGAFQVGIQFFTLFICLLTINF